MRPASIGIGPPQKAALFAVETVETKMKIYTLAELFSMTRQQLFALHDGIVAEINALPEADPARIAGLANLRLIRRVLAHPRLAP